MAKYSFTPAAFDVFVSILGKISSKKNKLDPIIIKDGKLIDVVSSSIIYVDFNNLVSKSSENESKFNFELLNHKESIGLMKTITTKDDIVLIDDVSQLKYFLYFKQGKYVIELKFPMTTETSSVPSIPDVDNEYEYLTTIVLDSDTIKVIEKMYKTSQSEHINIIYSTKDKEIVSIEVPEVGKIDFKEVSSDTEMVHIKTVDLLLFIFDSIELSIYKNEHDDYCIVRNYDVGYDVEFTSYEITVSDSFDIDL